MPAEPGRLICGGEGSFVDAPIPMAFVEPSDDAGRLGIIHAANPAMAHFSGRSVQQLQGLPFRTLVHPMDADLGSDQLERISRGEAEICSFEKRFEHADGHLIWGMMMIARATSHEHVGDFIVQIQDISERKHFVGQLEYLADHDPLTSLWNQRRFRVDLDRQIAYCNRHGGQGVVLMLDLDNFKETNDHFGHAAGNAVIIEVASTILSSSRETDLVARLGGDEFAVLLPQATIESGRTHAQKLLRDLNHKVVDVGGVDLSVKASIGVAGFTSNDGQCGDDVIINADLALYQAKESGRGQVRVFSVDAGLHDKVEARLLWSVRIRKALDEDGFVVHAKPIRDLMTGEVVYFELVILLKAAEGLLVQPSVFLYTAERFGMAIDIDEWMTRRALDILDSLEPDRQIPLAVNISGSALVGDRFVDFLRQQLARRKNTIRPGLLIFELNEAVALSNMEKAKRFGSVLNGMGCLFALDDFGAAFGSFYYLKHLPVDILKIDGEYVRGLSSKNDATDRLIIEAIVKLAEGLHTKVVAEFVGDLSIRDELINLGVTLGQGSILGVAKDVLETAELGPLSAALGPPKDA